MLQFKDYEYKRPDLELFTREFEKLLESFRDADSAKVQIDVIGKLNELRSEVDTMSTLSSIRHTSNTTDKFYEEENDFWDENGPKIEALINKYAKLLLESKFRGELEAHFGKLLFDKYEIQSRIFDESIIPDMIAENKLVSEYSKLVAVGKVTLRGKEYTLNDLTPLRQDVDRELRREANEAYFGYFADHVDEFDRIYDELVKLRTKMAKALGFENYIELGYLRLGRTDYGAKEVEGYRAQVLRDLVPEYKKLRDRQAKRLGLEKMYYYDEMLEYLTGNAVPQGDPEWIMEQGKKMYDELGERPKEFFKFMTDHDLFDVLSREGKAAGGYCTYITNYKSPFIFANFNGTSHDVDVLTHEAGHAFQVYESRNIPVPEYLWPTYEACEIHSMSMEFFAWPWMNLFFKHQEQKYKYSHLSGALLFIPYGVTIDEFQHRVYENPDMTPAQRRAVYREVEQKYVIGKDYGDNEFLNSGGFFFKQGHVFSTPFYYIDYTLAQICALQFWKKSIDDRENAMKDYVRLCQVGGSKSFVNLVEYANLKNPFVDGTIKATIEPAVEYLNGVDDSNL